MNILARVVQWIAASALAARVQMASALAATVLTACALTTSALVTSALAGISPVSAAEAAAVRSPTPIARSALLTVEATDTGESLAIRIRRVATLAPIDSKDVTVTVDGKSAPVTAQADGTLLLPIKDLRGDAERQLDIVVAHDGIREILTGKLTLPKVSAAADLWRDHKQIAWWILNIAIVLIAAILFSRRTSSS
ncbi:MAG: hypothetical protein JWN85_3517 [Gammaproteobacteria bacterium]|nr:hypothetical protein [Gammaproteobacteria bacterium]